MNRVMPPLATVMGRMPNRPSRSASVPISTNPTTIAPAMKASTVAAGPASSPATSRSHGPAQRLCTERKVAWEATVHGTTRQNSGLEKTRATPRNCPARLPPSPGACPRSGTTAKISTATVAVSSASTRNTPRQSVTVRASSTGAVAASAPRPPAPSCRPLTRGRRSRGNQCTKA